MTINYTPEEITEILNDYFSGITHKQYIGARYVPIFGRKDEDSILWDNTAPYEPLTIVLHQGNSYTSRQYVPIGIDISNENYWALTGNYNAQIEQYRLDVLRIGDSLPQNIFNSNYTVKNYIDENTVHTFETVADLQSSENIEDGMVAHTNGFHAIGDGGDAFYTIGATGTPNGMDVLALQNNLIATLVRDGNKVFISKLGAKGDGVEDDTAIIQRAFEIVESHGEVVFDAKSSYLITQPIVISNGKNYLHIYTNGKNENGPRLTANGIATIFDIRTPGHYIDDIYFENVSESREGIGILIARSGDPNIDLFVNRCTFSNLGYGIQSTGRNVLVDDCMFSFCKNGVKFNSYNETGATTAQKTMRGWIVRNCRFHGIGTVDSPVISELNHDSLDDIDSWCVQTDIISGVIVQNITVTDNLCDQSRDCGFYKGYSNGLMLANNSVSRSTYTFSIFAYLYNSGQTQYSAGNISNNILNSRANAYYSAATNDDTNLAGYWHFITASNVQRYLKIIGNHFDDSTREGIKLEGREIQINNNTVNSAGYGIATDPSAFIYIKPNSTGNVQVQGNFGFQYYNPITTKQFDVYSDGIVRINSDAISGNTFISTESEIVHMNSLNYTWAESTNTARFIINDRVNGMSTIQKVLELTDTGISYKHIPIDGSASTTKWTITP